MPGVPASGDDQLAYQIAQMHNMMRGMATQQQTTLTNSNGQPVLNFGLSPGSNPAQFGLQFVNPATGGQLMFVGEDGSGNAYTAFYDGSGTMRIKIDDVGFHVYDSSGTERARLGLTTNGDEGLQVFDPSGASNEILPRYISGSGSSGSVTSTTPTAVSGTSVTANIGASGNALVSLFGIGEMNGPAAAGGSAYFAVGVDGAAPAGLWSELQTNLTAAQLTAPVYISRLITGLTAGSHTFQSYVWSDSTGHSVNLFDAYTMVEPI